MQRTKKNKEAQIKHCSPFNRSQIIKNAEITKSDNCKVLFYSVTISLWRHESLPAPGIQKSYSKH